mmetsp:Transcript_24468/g.77336  ORF Transcript_24468/g.77336 Transcript_24468/m.77336 type:complete len:111 (-) Transcript_24468:381-713(-)
MSSLSTSTSRESSHETRPPLTSKGSVSPTPPSPLSGGFMAHGTPDSRLTSRGTSSASSLGSAYPAPYCSAESLQSRGVGFAAPMEDDDQTELSLRDVVFTDAKGGTSNKP